MALRPVHGLASLLVILACHCHGGGGSEQGADYVTERLERDVTSPLATVPVVDPTAAAAAATTPTTGAGGGSWCVASPSASASALQVALDYACGQGGADCSAIQQGGSCFSPDTVRDHASYAFSSYYQKNPVQTSCDFGGTAVLTTADPSTSTCQYPATSTGASVLNTSTPLTPTYGSPPGPGYGSSPPAGYGNSPPLYGNMSPPDYGDNISAAARALSGRRTTAAESAAAVVSLATTCLLTAALSLTTGSSGADRDVLEGWKSLKVEMRQTCADAAETTEDTCVYSTDSGGSGEQDGDGDQ